MSGASVRLDAVEFAYEDMRMVFDLAVEASSIVAVMGPSGSGKSTLLNLVAGFERPDGGRVLIAGSDVTSDPPARRPVSMVFQENNLFAHLDVAANVGLGRSPSLTLGENDRAAINEAIRETGLAGKERRLPAALSGGERQRVALARALVRDRPVLLLDEPFAALGPALRIEMLDLLSELHARQAMTVLMATHDPGDALHIAPTAIFLEHGTVTARDATGHLTSGDAPESVRRYFGVSGQS